MEYAIYAAVVLAGVLLCALAIRSNRALIDATPNRKVAPRGPEKSPDPPAGRDSAESGAGLGQVRTPWGWPGSGHYHSFHRDYLGASTLQPNGGARGLHQWVDHLVSSKQTTQDEAYLRHREMCLRALLEDRFYNAAHIHPVVQGSAVGTNTSQPNAHAAGALRQRDSSSRSAEGPAVGEPNNKHPVKGKRQDALLSEIRTPWGW